MSIVECASPVYQAGTQTLVVACGECKPCLRAKLAAAEKNLSMALTEVERNTKDTEDLHKRLADAENCVRRWLEAWEVAAICETEPNYTNIVPADIALDSRGIIKS